MGGKAAKERRRAQREQLQGDNGASPVAHKKRSLPPSKGGRPMTPNQKFKRDAPPKKAKAGKVKKVKKPKHLKRKLETIDDEEERTKLLVALEAWDETKAKHSKQPNKKQKVENSTAISENDATIKAITTQPSKSARSLATVTETTPKSLPSSRPPAAVAGEEELDVTAKPARQSEKKQKAESHTATITDASAEPNTKENAREEAKRSKSAKKAKQQKKNITVSTDTTDGVTAKATTKVSEADQQLKETMTEAEPSVHAPQVAVVAREDKGASSDSDDSSVEDVAETARRQRGKRRRGRQDTEKHILASREKEDVEKPKVPQASSPNQGKPTNDATSDAELNEPVNPNETEEERLERKKRDKREYDKRYCVGRKPVTDFEIGQRYSGRVVYVKPFGVFIDIGCHSDAFCHVSRLRDDFVDSAADAVKEGDPVEARVVEIDRKQKRLTVSLQSDARIEDERASIEARNERRAKHTSKKRKLQPKANDDTVDEEVEEPKEDTPKQSVKPKPPAAAKPIPGAASAIRPFSAAVKPFSAAVKPASFDDSGLASPADLKRARKLARRAERRAMKE